MIIGSYKLQKFTIYGFICEWYLPDYQTSLAITLVCMLPRIVMSYFTEEGVLIWSHLLFLLVLSVPVRFMSVLSVLLVLMSLKTISGFVGFK